MEVNKLKILSLFSGIAGFELGIKQAIGDRAEFVGFSEIDKYAISIYQKHFNHKNYGNITKINPSELPDFDLIVGGFPCQSFSIAGKRGGFEDTRGTLFFNIAEIARVKKPRLLLLENVKGLMSHNEGNTFATIISTLDELGYDCQWQVLNSKNFGVPQNRERVFIIGHLRGTSRPEVFPIGTQGKTNVKKPKIIGNTNRNQRERGNVHSSEGLVGALTATDYKQPKQIADYRHDEGLRIRKEFIANTLQAQARQDGTAGQPLLVIPVLTPNRAEKRQNGRRFKENGEPSFTLTAQDKHGIYDGAKIRRLTPTECERLQGFPDGWTEWGFESNKKMTPSKTDFSFKVELKETTTKISDTQRYKTLGNAVTVNVIQAIMEKLF